MSRLQAGQIATLVLGIAFLVLLTNAGARFAIGVLIPPMEADLGWTRSTLSASVALFMVVTALALPISGRMVDRLGAFRVLVFGVSMAGVALAFMSRVASPLEGVFVYGVLFALGSAATSITPVGVLLNRWFPTRTGMANAVAISGMGIGQLVVVSVLSAHLAALGWRQAFVFMSLGTLVCLVPLIVVSRFASADTTTPTNVRANAATPSPIAKPATLSRVFASPRIWLVLVVYAICGAQDFFVATHFVAFALGEGVASEAAGNTLALMGLSGLMGVLIAGYAADKYGPELPTAVCFGARILVFSVFWSSPNENWIFVAALLYGATFWVTAPLTVVFAGTLGGAAMLGTLSGLITMVHHLAGGAGVLVGGRVFDALGSYESAMAILLALSILGVVLTLALRSPKR
ncbi:MAG: MFS transporter [Gammaproteobacteria bacterium]|nr:MFS transporter [Gammaproteobacteria bacterium]